MPERMHYVIYTIINNDKATYSEIRDKLDIYEVLALYESIVISTYNRQLYLEGVK